jgi:IclR family pca regulon transcriptional regulator
LEGHLRPDCRDQNGLDPGAQLEVRARGWALTDEQLAPGIRSVAAPLRDGSGRIVAALNVNAHAAETGVRKLIDNHLPLLLATAGDISADFARRDGLPDASRPAS